MVEGIFRKFGGHKINCLWKWHEKSSRTPLSGASSSQQFNREPSKMHEMRNKLDLHMDYSMPCNLRKVSGKSSSEAPKDPQEKNCDEREQGEVLCKDHTKGNKTIHACTRESAFRRLETEIMKIILLQTDTIPPVIAILCTSVFPCLKQ